MDELHQRRAGRVSSERIGRGERIDLCEHQGVGGDEWPMHLDLAEESSELEHRDRQLQLLLRQRVAPDTTAERAAKPRLAHALFRGIRTQDEDNGRVLKARLL